MTQSITLDSHEIHLSNTEKVFFPDAELTKGDVIDYYRRISDVMMPYLQNRPLNMHRFPDGVTGEGFFQQNAPDYFPDWIRRVSVEKENGHVTHAVCDQAATLVYLANQACMTPHSWLSQCDRLNYPDRMIFDLDPPSDDFEIVRDAARSLRDIIHDVGLHAFVMTTGSRGLHVVIPLDCTSTFDDARTVAQDLATVLAHRDPERLTTAQYIEQRNGRLFLDTKRNAYAQTSVTPYSVRAKPGAPVATPLDWDELSDHSLHSQSYTIQNLFRRLGQKPDPWQVMLNQPCSLDQARSALNDVMATIPD
ncbi:MAG: non-homologous end-joining DNA ligase [Elainellaceae cyanobacterium]